MNSPKDFDKWRVSMSNFNEQHHDQFLPLYVAAHEPALRTFVRSLLPSLSDVPEV
jgi:hypothetical protein